MEAFVGDDLDVEAWVEQMIAQNGYAQLSVHDKGSGVPGFAFTIGLQASRAAPELCVMGVAPDIAAQLFAICIEGHDTQAVRFGPGTQDLPGLIDGHVLRLRPVPSAMILRANTVRPQRFSDISAMVQLLLPDDAGYFPGDAECAAQVAAAQDPDWLLAGVTN